MLNKLAIITGASKGIGFEITRQLIDKGCNVAICSRNIENLLDLLIEKNIDQKKFYVKSVDVNIEAEICAFIDEIEEKFDTIDYLFNNVGMNSAKADIFNIKTSDFDAMYAVNMRAPMIFTREVAKVMRANNTHGTIINTQSTCNLFSNPLTGSYTASKSGFDALSKIFRKELRDNEIKVLNIYPGGVDTPFRSNARPDYLRPENVAQAILKQLDLATEIYLDDIVLRPLIERNF